MKKNFIIILFIALTLSAPAFAKQQIPQKADHIEYINLK